MKNKYLDSVTEFHAVFGHPISENPDNMDLNLRKLRIKLLFEELQELSQALDVMGTFNSLCVASSNELCDVTLTDKVDGDNVDAVEALDALCDIQYVLSGAVLALGYGKTNDIAFDRVHQSNMSKVCNSKQELDDTIHYYNEQHVETTYKEVLGKYLIYRKIDNKVLKNKYYNKVELSDLIKKESGL